MCSWYDSGEGAEGGSTGAEGNSMDGVRWQRFLTSLSEKGYFRVSKCTYAMCYVPCFSDWLVISILISPLILQSELEGSKLYQKLLDDARKYFYGTVLLDKE